MNIHSLLAASLALCLATPALRADDPYTPEYTQGNLFTYRTSSDRSILTNRGGYIRFTATSNTTANSLYLYLNSNAATSLTVGLQADDGTGKPDGTFLTSTTLNTLATGWNKFTLPDQALEGGATYHVVINPSVGGNAVLRRLLANTPAEDNPFEIQTYGIRDTSYAYGTLTGSTASAPATDAAVNFVIGTTGSQGIGMAYFNTSQLLIPSDKALAQRFKFVSDTPGNNVLQSVTVRLLSGASDLHDVEFTVLNDQNEKLGSTILAAADITPGVGAYYTVTFSGGLELTEGAYYRLALNVLGDGPNSVRWYTYQTGSTDEALNAATFQGTDGYAFSYNDLTFSSEGAALYGYDYAFSYTTAVPEPQTAVLGLGAIALLALRRKTRPRRA